MPSLGFVCLIALAEARPLDLLPVRAALHRYAPEVPLAIERGPRMPDQTSLKVDYDGQIFAVHLGPGRLPEAEYQRAVTGNLLWPAAADMVARHAGCLAVAAARAPQDNREARLQAIAITRLAAALCEASRGLGLHWSGTEAMTAPERLAAAPDEIDRGDWPTDIWLGYEVSVEDRNASPQSMGVRTHGGVPFFGCELDLPPMPAPGMLAPLRRLAAIARALVGRDMEVIDGESFQIGQSAAQGGGDGPEGLYQVRRVPSRDGPAVARLIPT